MQCKGTPGGGALILFSGVKTSLNFPQKMLKKLSFVSVCFLKFKVSALLQFLKMKKCGTS